MGDRAALGDHRRVGRRADVLLDPFRGTPRGFVCAGLVLADRDSAATVVAPEGCVADEAGHPSDEFLDLLVSLLELIEEFRSTVAGIAANDCVHDCLLETRRGMRVGAGRSSFSAELSVKDRGPAVSGRANARRGHSGTLAQPSHLSLDLLTAQLRCSIVVDATRTSELT